MYKLGDVILDSIVSDNGILNVELETFLPLGEIKADKDFTLELSNDGVNFQVCQIKANQINRQGKYIRIKALPKTRVIIKIGKGYYAKKNREMSEKFFSTHNWSGADGIYSFNLDRTEDYNQQDDNTMFVFGDTFCGQVDSSYRRGEPTAMVNNSLTYYKSGKIDFFVRRKEKGDFASIFEMDKSLQRTGYLPENLVDYSSNNKLPPYASALDPANDVELTFDFHSVHTITSFQIENYHEEPDFDLPLNKRGAKKVSVYAFDEKAGFYLVTDIEVDMYSIDKPFNDFKCDIRTKLLKFVFHLDDGFNHGGLNKDDKIVGLNNVRFFSEDEQLFDVSVTSNSEFNVKYINSWFWLQDGVINNGLLYTYPLIVQEDLNGVEGFEFKITGVCEIICPLKDKKLDYSKAKMRKVPLLIDDGEIEYTLPSAILNNVKEDGYLYFYGFSNNKALFERQLIVGRIRPENLGDYNYLEYFDGNGYSKDVTKAKGLLKHVSCEMSVQKIIKGANEGKYLAVFQYDTNGPFVSYSIGESLTGPFEEPRIIHQVEELQEFYKTTYSYNAKSHLHLSSEGKILVSYNVNDMSMANNKKEARIYHPRFLDFIDTSLDEGDE